MDFTSFLRRLRRKQTNKMIPMIARAPMATPAPIPPVAAPDSLDSDCDCRCDRDKVEAVADGAGMTVEGIDSLPPL